MANLSAQIKAVAQSLIATVGMTAAVASTDIRSQAGALHKQYAEYTQIQIANKISDEIKKTHRPGVSGSL
ncbi:hypothetical protein [Glutamicibacter ardleyensis]|uniref:hypothetical protein n=1 Tax=Glutamicibacter ardleyensis TaxID=225894 RepID=UPI003FD284CF